MDRFINSAADKYNDPQAILGAAQRIRNQIYNFSAQSGQSAVVGRQQTAAAWNKLYDAAITRFAVNNAAGAKELFDDGVERGLISGTGQTAIAAKLKPYLDIADASRAYSAATSGPVATRIAQAAYGAGVEPSMALSIWSAEGAVTDPETKNPNSSAMGVFQFMPGTWSDMGGTQDNRTDANEQISKGVELIKRNMVGFMQDMGRWPQGWESYLAHQQGLGGAEQLIKSDPGAPAASIVGEKAVTENGGTADMSASEFLAHVRQYFQSHAMQYNADGTPTAQNLERNYEAGLQAMTDLAAKDHPNDPEAVKRYRSFYMQQTGQTIGAAKMAERANGDILRQALAGQNGAKSWSEFLSDPARVQAYAETSKIDPVVSNLVDRAITANAQGMWDPPASAQSAAQYDELKGMRTTDRDRFANLDLMEYYGSVPAAQFQELQNDQALVRKKDPAAAQNQTRLSQALVLTNPVFVKAGIDPDPSSANYNIAVGRLDSALNQWSANNNNKLPDDGQIVQIARQMLFPGGQPEEPRGTGGWLLSALSPDEAQAKGAAPDDKNSGASINSATNVVESQGRVDEAGGTQHRAENASWDTDTTDLDQANDEAMILAAGAARGVSKEQPAPKTGLAIIRDVPSGTVTYRTGDGHEFLAPAQADWNAVFEAGKANGLNPFGINRAVGHFGKFDFQRDGSKKLFYDAYVHASNFAVGVFMRGAGYSLAETKVIGRVYADLKSNNPNKEEQSEWWIRGWMAADSGKFPTRLQ